jgi:hypothetical protein
VVFTGDPQDALDRALAGRHGDGLCVTILPEGRTTLPKIRLYNPFAPAGGIE